MACGLATVPAGHLIWWRQTGAMPQIATVFDEVTAEHTASGAMPLGEFS